MTKPIPKGAIASLAFSGGAVASLFINPTALVFLGIAGFWLFVRLEK